MKTSDRIDIKEVEPDFHPTLESKTEYDPEKQKLARYRDAVQKVRQPNTLRFRLAHFFGLTGKVRVELMEKLVEDVSTRLDGLQTLSVFRDRCDAAVDHNRRLRKELEGEKEMNRRLKELLDERDDLLRRLLNKKSVLSLENAFASMLDAKTKDTLLRSLEDVRAIADEIEESVSAMKLFQLEEGPALETSLTDLPIPENNEGVWSVEGGVLDDEGSDPLLPAHELGLGEVWSNPEDNRQPDDDDDEPDVTRMI